MDSPSEIPSKYWRLVRITASSRISPHLLPTAKTYLAQHLTKGAETATDTAIQAYLLSQWQAAADQITVAEGCLRCYVSNQVEWVCQDLEARFGERYGFTRYELFPFVLDETYPLEPLANSSSETYCSLAADILRSFDPQRASLSTWVTRRVRHHRDLNRFLLQHGVYLVSDWAILNDTSVKQVSKILGEFHGLSPTEVTQAQQLLQSYHGVYRRDRIQQRQAGGGGGCVPPTPEQLQRLAQQLPRALAQKLSEDDLLGQLQALASYLRHYRIHVRGGLVPTESLDRPEIAAVAQGMRAPAPQEDDTAQFLAGFRQVFDQCLQQAIATVIETWLARLQRRQPEKIEPFLKALRLFHCDGLAMGEIARQIGFSQQYQVSRLLKLKALRADIRQHLLQQMCDRTRQLAQAYVDPERLHHLNAQIDAALAERVDSLMATAETEATTQSQHRSQFTVALCRHLDSRR
ncbi:hypothetical protein [Halomicronema hongdechloris]|nr:hypothetical protein [Halomicronema hongdechloris]